MRKDRNQSGGGVFLAVKGNFVSVEEPEFDAPCEIVWSSMEFVKAGRVFIGSFYRTPNNDFDPVNHLSDSLAKVLSKIKSHCNIIICGDFNFPDINWEAGETKGDSRRKKLHDDFLDFLSESGLTQLNTLITRPRSQNVLDLICTNNPNVVSNIRTKPGVSDHDIVLFDLNLKPKRMSKPPRKIYNFKKAATQSIKEALEANSRDFFLNEPMNKSVNENWTTFKNYVLNTTEKYVPHHFSKGKQSHPWIDHSIVKQMRKRDKLYSAAKKTKSKRLWASYKKQRNNVTATLRQSYTHYMEEVLGPSLETSPKRFWSFIRSQRKDAVSIPTLISDGEACVSDISKAEALNKQFSSVFTDENLSAIPNKGHSAFSSIQDLDIELQGVIKQLTQINIHKAGDQTVYQPGCFTIMLQNLHRCCISSFGNPMQQELCQMIGEKLLSLAYTRRE
ncbi:uncharacterized protein [Amphiura filiformis]|uniref:uncharacterized protein n=1 Tax=Amphiura filiformis TaxID=82378 RepID=UPI003B2289A7